MTQIAGEIFPITAPNGTAWISLDDAAKRSGWSVGHIRRMCGERFLSSGLARLDRPQDGRRSTWMIREDADASFARVKFADQLSSEFDVRALSQSQRDTVNQRKQILDSWHADLAAGVQLSLSEAKVTASFLDKLLITQNLRLSRGTLYRWKLAARDGIGALVDGRGKEKSDEPAKDDPFVAEVLRLWLRQSRPKLKTCYEHVKLIAEDQSPQWAICSFKTIQRRAAALPEQVVTKMRFGEEAFKNQILPAPKRDYSTIGSNEWWCSDHHQFDVIVNASQNGQPVRLCRPWITCWQDLRSRKIVGWHIFAHDPNTSTILLSLRSAMLADGVPQTVLIDNGKDFDSYALQGETKMQRQVRRKLKIEFDAGGGTEHSGGGVLGILGVKVVHAIAFNAKAKPVERFFGTLCDRFSKFKPTYCGRNPQEKPDNLPDQLARGNAPVLEDFAAEFAIWVEQDYNHRPHEGDAMDGMTPAQAFETNLVSRRVARSEDLQLLIQKTSKPLIAGRYGVTWDGISYGRGDAALFSYFGSKVYLRVDPDDVTVAAVYDLNDKFIADVKANIDMPFGATEQQFRAAARERAQIRELTNRFYNLGPRSGASVVELMAIKNDERRPPYLPAPPGNNPPPSLQPVRTPLEGQIIPLRTAAGAEGMSIRPVMPRAKIIDLISESEDFEMAQSPRSALRMFDEDDDGVSTERGGSSR